MSKPLFSNRAESTLDVAILAGATTLTVPLGDEAEFPTLGANNHCIATITDGITVEVIKILSMSVNTFTVIRALEGTTAQDWAKGTGVEVRLTAGGIDELRNALGQGSTGSIEVGNSSAALGTSSLAVGLGANAQSTHGVTIGSSAFEGYGASWKNIAVGYQTRCNNTTLKNNGAALGSGAQVVDAAYGTAIGWTAQATFDGATAIGPAAAASGNRSIAIGDTAAVSGLYGVAVGYSASASGGLAIALGHNSDTRGFGAVAIGAYAYAQYDGAIAVGDASANGYYSISVGDSATAENEWDVAIGYNADTLGQNTTGQNVAVGAYAYGYGGKTVAVGAYAYADDYAYGSVCVGYSAAVGGIHSTAIGYKAGVKQSTTSHTNSLGYNAGVDRAYATNVSGMPTLKRHYEDELAVPSQKLELNSSEAVLSSTSIDFKSVSSVTVEAPVGMSIIPTSVIAVSDLGDDAVTIGQPTISFDSALKKDSFVPVSKGATEYRPIFFDGTTYYQVNVANSGVYPNYTCTFTIRTSTDATTWAVAGTITTPATATWYDGVSSFQMIGANLVFISTHGGVWTSVDSGANWTSRKASDANYVAEEAVAVNGTEAILMDRSLLYKTTDSGVTWVAQSPTGITTTGSVQCYFGGGAYYSISYGGGAVVRSVDGITWTAYGTATVNATSMIILDSGKVIAWESGGASSTTDGVTWAAQSLGSTQDVRYVVPSGTNVLTVGRGSPIGSVSADDGATWKDVVLARDAEDVRPVSGSNKVLGSSGSVVSHPNWDYVADFTTLAPNVSTPLHTAAVATGLGVKGFQVFAAPTTQVQSITMNVTVAGTAADGAAAAVPYFGRLLVKGIVLESK